MIIYLMLAGILGAFVTGAYFVSAIVYKLMQKKAVKNASLVQLFIFLVVFALLIVLSIYWMGNNTRLFGC
jgi:hypothetical protein